MPARLIIKGNKQYRIGSPLLPLFSAPFIVWQMGVLYFSGTTMSLFGRTPIPLVEEDTTLVIAAGYAASILAICLFPRYTVYMERALLPAALLSTALMLFPFSAEIITALFCISAFVCVFSIGTMASAAAHQFTVDTTWRDGIISMMIGGVLIAALQNDFFEISFTAFTIFSVLLIAALTAFFYIVPAKIEVTYAKRKKGKSTHKLPWLPFLGVWAIAGCSTLMICFASSFAESVENGMSSLFLSAAICAGLLYLISKKQGERAIKTYGFFFMSSALGFVAAFASLEVPALRLAACVLLGFIVVLANLWIFFVAAAFSLYPTRFIGAVGAGMGFLLAMLHSELLRLFRDDLPALFGIYAVLSVVLIILYYLLEPYLAPVWKRESAEGARIASRRAASRVFDVLSEQERNLAELILAGYSESTIARQMNISLNTQKSYRKNIYAKLDIHSKTELFSLSELK